MGSNSSGIPKGEMIRLDGTAIQKDGTEIQTDYFKFLSLPADHAVNLNKTLTPSQAIAFKNHISQMKIGTSAIIPRICSGPKCKVVQCPFHVEKNWPLAEPCVLELNLIVNWTKSYIEELNIDLDSRTELILVNKLVECDIIDYRANIALSVDEEVASLLKVDIFDDGQKTSTVTNMHPILEIKDRINKQRGMLLESLAATRKEKYKKAAALKKREDQSIGDHFASLKAALNAAQKKPVASLEEIDKETIDADWEQTDL